MLWMNPLTAKRYPVLMEPSLEEKMVDVDIGYVRLIVAIIKQAIVDAKREVKYGRVGGYSASLFINSEEFIEICHLIDCDGEMIRNKVFRDLGII